MLYDVKKEFARTGSAFPIQAEDIVRERFEYRREYQEMEAREREKQEIADMLGSGQVPKSLSDEILEETQRPEIMGIDFSQFQTQKESVVPPEVRKFYETNKQSFFSRLASGFMRFFRRRE